MSAGNVSVVEPLGHASCLMGNLGCRTVSTAQSRGAQKRKSRGELHDDRSRVEGALEEESYAQRQDRKRVNGRRKGRSNSSSERETRDQH